MRVLLSRMHRWVNDLLFYWGKGISTVTSERTCINIVQMWERIFMILCVFIYFFNTFCCTFICSGQKK